MKSFRLLLLGSAALLLAGWPLATSAADSPIELKSPNTPANRTPLTRGMTEEEVVNLVGRPTRVRAIETVSGRGERWTYRRVVERRSTDQAASTVDVPAVVGFSDRGAIMGTRPKLVYQTKLITTYQITELLMFEGQLVMGNQRVETEEAFTG